MNTEYPGLLVHEEILDRISDAVVVLDDNWVCTYLNERAQKVLKRDGIDLLGKNVWEVLPGMEGQLFYLQLHESMKTGQPKFLEDYYPAFNKWYHFSIYPSPTGLTVLIKNISFQKKSWGNFNQSDRRYQVLFEMNPLPMWVVDDERLRFLDVNQATVQHYGFTREEFLGMDTTQIRLPEDVEKHVKNIRNPSDPGYGGVWRHRKKDGSIVFMDIYHQALTINEKRVWLALAIDVTEKIKAEEELEKSMKAMKLANERFDYLLKATNDGVWETDMATGKFWMSDNIYSLLKYDINSFSPGSVESMSYVHLDDLGALLKNMGDAVESKSNFWSAEFRILRGDGTYGFFMNRSYILRNEQGVPEKMLGALLDLTEIKKYERALAQSETQLRTIIESEPECVKVVDHNYIVLDINPAGLEILEADRREKIIGQDVLGLIDKSYHPEYKKNLEQVFEGVPAKMEFEICTMKGNRKWVESHMVPLKNKEGDIANMLAITRDITQNRKAEEELKNMNEQLRLLSTHLLKIREEERTQVAREIHDELGQQLTGLKIDLSWLRKKMPAGYPVLDTKIQEMLSLIDDTVKSVRKISTALRPTLLDELGLVAALEWQCQEFQRRTGIVAEFTSDLSDVNFDKTLATGIFRVYQESLTNIARHSEATRVDSSLIHTNGNLTLKISDNGCGLKTQSLRAKKTLGLVGMQERAAMLGGRLEIESGQGTHILLTVPLRNS